VDKAIHDGVKRTGTQAVLLKQNVLIVWKPEYNLGIPIIDEQHRGIVSTINSLHFGMQSKYAKEMLTPIIEMMHSYTLIHFHLEEDFLEKINSPEAQRHIGLHLELSQELDRTGRDTMLNRDPYKFVGFLKQWWLDHICCEDLIFRDNLYSNEK